MRVETRRQRYNKKINTAVIMPVRIATINFNKEANIGYVVRAAACYGASQVMCIGSSLDRDIMNDLSGSTLDYVSFVQFGNVEKFMSHIRSNKIKLIAMEPPGEWHQSISLRNYKFDFETPSCIIVGNETTGISEDILTHSECIYVDMPGPGYSLNTSQAANVALYVAASQFAAKGGTG